MFSKILHTALVTIVLLASCVAARPSLSLTFSGPASVDNVDNLTIVTTLQNTGPEPVQVLNDPNGPLSKVPTDTFTIADTSGATPAFNGIKAKYVPRVAAAAYAYTVLAPGQSIDVEHNLSEAYNFTSSGAGTYTINANNIFYVVGTGSSITEVEANTPSNFSTDVSGQLAVTRRSLSFGKRATFNGCSASQQSDVVSAASAAQSYASSTSLYASKLTNATVRYKSWFGAFSASRHNIVISILSKINSNTFSSFKYDCTCPDLEPRDRQGTFAYVYPNRFGTVYLCGAFWEAPLTGTNSKAGTIIHESSHFYANGGTDDFFYGQTAARSNAASNPARAVKNADNYEYFAENAPAEP